MPSSLRAMVRRFQLRLKARQLTLTKLLIKDTTSNAGEADELIAEAEAKERDSGRQWLYTTVGHALSSWAIIEENLVVIATLLLRLSPSEAGLILYSIINFNTWLSIIGELFKMEEGYEKLIPEWNRFSNRLRRLKTIRDNLAHQTVVYNATKGM